MNADVGDTSHENEECVLSKSGVEYSLRLIPPRRRLRNIVTQFSEVN